MTPESRSVAWLRLMDLLPGGLIIAKVVALAVEFAITTTARAAGAAAAEQIFFGRHFKLLKFEYYFHSHGVCSPFFTCCGSMRTLLLPSFNVVPAIPRQLTKQSSR